MLTRWPRIYKTDTDKYIHKYIDTHFYAVLGANQLRLYRINTRNHMREFRRSMYIQTIYGKSTLVFLIHRDLTMPTRSN